MISVTFGKIYCINMRFLGYSLNDIVLFEEKKLQICPEKEPVCDLNLNNNSLVKKVKLVRIS